jgi:dTDP-4-dehydrorhamnose 3,5-epimerase
MEKTYLQEIHGAVIIGFNRHKDNRGYFQEIYNSEKANSCWEFFPPLGAQQINLSQSKANTIRGLHVAPYSKLVTCLKGRIFDVVADVRKWSPTCGNWYGVWLTERNQKQLLVPRGCAHGFFAENDESVLLYAQDGNYAPEKEYGINWKDPRIQVVWPEAKEYHLSDKDRNAPMWEG